MPTTLIIKGLPSQFRIDFNSIQIPSQFESIAAGTLKHVDLYVVFQAVGNWGEDLSLLGLYHQPDNHKVTSVLNSDLQFGYLNSTMTRILCILSLQKHRSPLAGVGGHPTVKGEEMRVPG